MSGRRLWASVIAAVLVSYVGVAQGTQPVLQEGVAWAAAGARLLEAQGVSADPCLDDDGGGGAIARAVELLMHNLLVVPRALAFELRN